MIPRDYMSVKDVCEYLGVSRWTIYAMVNDRQIPFVKIGKLLRFNRHAVDDALAKRTVKAAPVSVHSINSREG
jgi:excisionase family DNA binding protein